MATIPRSMMGLPSSPSFRYKALNPAYQSDPRRILGQQLMQQGSSSAPVATPLQGLGRLSSALVGAYLQKGAIDRQVAREGEYKDKLTSALAGMDMSAMPIGFENYAQINPEGAMQLGLNYGIQKKLAEAKAPGVFKPATSEQIKAYGGNTDVSGLYQINSKTNELKFTPINNIPKSGFAPLVSQLIRINAIPENERTEADSLMFKFYSAQLSRNKKIQVVDQNTGNIVLQEIPGIDVKGILSGETTSNVEKKDGKEKDKPIVKFAKLHKTESEYVGQLKTSQTELDKLINILFENGDIENGAINTKVIGLLSFPGTKVFSGDAKVANNILMNLSDLTLRKRTGATANQSEIDLYYGQITPGITDGEALTRFKIQRLVRDLNNNIGVFTQGRTIKDLKPLVINTKQSSSDEEVNF